MDISDSDETSEKKRKRSGDSGDGEPEVKRSRELIQIWVKIGEDGEPEEVSIEPNSTVSKLKKEIRKNEEFYHFLYFEGEPVPIEGLVLVRDGEEDGESMNPRKELGEYKITDKDTVVVHVRSTGSLSKFILPLLYKESFYDYCTMPFLDRENEMQDILNTVKYNYNSQEFNDVHWPEIILTSQMYGSGKTRLGHQFFKVYDGETIKDMTIKCFYLDMRDWSFSLNMRNIAQSNLQKIQFIESIKLGISDILDIEIDPLCSTEIFFQTVKKNKIAIFLHIDEFDYQYGDSDGSEIDYMYYLWRDGDNEDCAEYRY